MMGGIWKWWKTNCLYIWKKPFIIYERDDEGVNEIHGMNETQRNRRGIYSNKRHKLGDIILKFKILNKNY